MQEQYDYLEENNRDSSEEAFAADLAEVLTEAGGDMFVTEQVVVEAYTFAGAGLLTRNAGVVVRMADGTEYQLTVVQSSAARAVRS